MDQHNGKMPKTSLYREEYCLEFVRRWDELIDWEKRYESENGFFRQILRENRVKNILDIACGTGFHTLTLSKAGFNVTGADGSANMLAKAMENAERFGLNNVRFVEAEWTCLSQAFLGEKFDAIICLGNTFTHLFEEEQRVKALKDDGIAIIDQRNYDMILDKGFRSKHQHYYLGETVNISAPDISDEAVKIRYEYGDGSVYWLTFSPIRQEYLTSLLGQAGFRQVERYGDFQAKYDIYEPDFIVQVAKKRGALSPSPSQIL